MKAVTFSGGIHPSYNKDLSSAVTTRPLDPPEEIVIPLSQHIGAPARTCVEKGDEVLIGQPVGDAGGFVSSVIHSSVSGKVKGVEPRAGAVGTEVNSVVIENDGQDRTVDFSGLGDDWRSAETSELKDRIQQAGLVGMGGAAFPTHVKLSPPDDKPIDAVILNGAECEPYLTADHRLMLEHPADVITGLSIVMKILGASQGFVGVEVNKPDALEALREASADSGITVVPLQVKYPQGAEKQLIDACLKRQVPSGGLPMDVGVVVQNVGTAAAITDAVVRGRPLYERILTVTGAGVAEPANLVVRMGTPVAHAIDACGGVRGELGKLVLGGPMMGFAQYTDQVPVTKGTSGILLLEKSAVDTREPDPCIRCGRCARACPMRIIPADIAAFSARQMYERAEEYDALDCIECGSCAFGCPSRIGLVQHIRLAKAAIMAQRRKGN